jgi:hypothetical protein
MIAQHAIPELQKALCARFEVAHVPAPPHLKAGVAANFCGGIVPLNGLRHPPASGTTGWFLWGGETLSDDSGFFAPLHVAHLAELCPQVLPYLGLPPGWRFLLAGPQEDVWYDPALLEI